MSFASERFPSPLAAKLSGVAIGKLDAWCRRGILKPSIAKAKGHGISRVWSFADLVAMRMLEDVHRAGSLSRVRMASAIRYVRRRPALDEMSATTFVVIKGDEVFELDLGGDDVRVSGSDLCAGEITVLTFLRVGLIVQQLLGAARAQRAA